MAGNELAACHGKGSLFMLCLSLFSFFESFVLVTVTIYFEQNSGYCLLFEFQLCRASASRISGPAAAAEGWGERRTKQASHRVFF